MKLKLAFWSAVLLAVAGAQAPDGALLYFFAMLLLAASFGLLMRRLEQAPRSKAKGPGKG
jgi:hypothetical protein